MTDKQILNGLAIKYMEIASLPIHKEKARLWTDLNDLKKTRPMVWVNEYCWNEMNINDELTLKCVDPFARAIEDKLRKDIYEWEHVPCDKIIEPIFYVNYVIYDTGYGIDEDVDVVSTDSTSDVVSREFHKQIYTEKDIEKIKYPEISVDLEASNINLEKTRELIGDVIPCKLIGQVTRWYAPWDNLIRYWGVMDAMMDLILNPELVHMALRKYTDSSLMSLKKYEELGLLSVTSGNYRVGSGGLGYTTELPGADFNPNHVVPKNQWGHATAQIFSEVSPEQHYEFALKYEIEWLKNFGLNYYGCCEPLHLKMDILKEVPNLRKVSMSAWANIEKMVEASNGKYVLSFKPNPALLAGDDWYPEKARDLIKDMLDKTNGHPVEIIFKDLSTVRYKPERLFEWVQMTMEEVQK